MTRVIGFLIIDALELGAIALFVAMIACLARAAARRRDLVAPAAFDKDRASSAAHRVKETQRTG